MKRRFLTMTIFLLASLSLFAKSKLTIKNTVGADLDEVGDYDFFTNSKETDVNGDTQSSNSIAFGDRFQLDYESPLVNARARLEFLYSNADTANAKFLFVPAGFVHFTPIQQFGIVAGNNFYKYFAIPSAYLAAADDTTKYGRLLTDSLGEERYFGSENVAVFSNGFAGGITSSWNFGPLFYLKLAGGATMYPDENEFEKALDFGLNAGISQLFDFGFTAHNVTEDDRKYGLFAGYTGNPDLVLNTGFYYNFTDSDYLAEARVTRSGVDKFKKQKTEYALGLTGGYNFRELGFSVYADFITGLNDAYIGTIEYYDQSGNLVTEKTSVIKRGSTIVKYYYNSKGTKVKYRTDEYSEGAVPLYAQLRLNYVASTSLELACNIKLRTMLRDSSQSWFTFYPRAIISPEAIPGEFSAGVRLDMNLTRYDGISSISIPLTYTYKFKKKF
ncbi:MAG: hypothetical protein IKO39_03030 [Treponema sp.]|nr:hypothetical protein [Treponema sp.]